MCIRDRIGHVDEISRTVVEGWAVDTERPDEAVSVSIFVNGEHRGMCQTTHARADLIAPNGDVLTGKCAFYFAFDPPLSPFIELRVEVVESWSSVLLENGSLTLPRPDIRGGGDAGRAPILLTSTGRAGTTLLMSEFARHPRIVIGDKFPYEIKLIAYYAAAFRTLAGDADRERSTTPETMLAPEMSRIIGSNPYNIAGLFDMGGAEGTLRAFWQSTVPSGFAELFRTFIVEYYATLADAQGKHSAPFFCEKSDVHDAAVQGARLFFAAVKDIVIVRDPRDLLSSAIAFWKLRPETAMTILTTTIPRLARIARHAGPDSVVIRYEDLVRDPVNARLRLSDFLDLDLTWRAEADAIPDSHRTSPDPAASIGRWRHDLTKQQVDACEAAFGLYMREFDYRPARSGKSRRKTASSQLVAAEGAVAIAAFETNTVAEIEDGSPSLRVLELSFGRQGNGEVCLQHGWSFPERGFVWSCARESTVRLPAIRRSGDYRLHITLMPFTHAVALPVQRATVLLDGHKIGTARLSDIGILSIAVPDQVPCSGQVVTLTLCFPDAARPAEVIGGDDRRLLGFSLHRIALSRVETKPGTAGQAETPEWAAGRLVGRMVETFRQALRHPDLQYDATTLMRDIQGFDIAGFVR